MNLAPGYRGGERQTELLVRALAEKGHLQRLVIRKGNSLAQRCADVTGLEIREVASNPVAAGLAAKGSRIAHAHDGRTVYSAFIAKLLFGIPYVITRRVVARQSKSWLRSRAYGHASRIVAITPATLDMMRLTLPDLCADVIADACADFAVNAEAVARIRSQRPGKTFIGHIGALDHSSKGQSTIIEVARMAAHSRPDWHFLLCGDGKDEQRLQREIGTLDNIELLGWVENVGDYLASFDIFVFPSLHEALGSTLLDAMQFGLPIVASNVGGIPGIIVDGVNGILIEPEDPAGLFRGLATILDDDAMREQMGRCNTELARNYGAERMAAAYEAIYEVAQ